MKNVWIARQKEILGSEHHAEASAVYQRQYHRGTDGATADDPGMQSAEGQPQDRDGDQL